MALFEPPSGSALEDEPRKSIADAQRRVDFTFQQTTRGDRGLLEGMTSNRNHEFSVSRELLIVGHKFQTIGASLRQKHTIKRIPMKKRHHI